MGTLRFLLALCVVVTHSSGSKLFGYSLLSGITAVQGFYIVSGFLITLVLNTRTEYRDVSRFYLSRYLRLWPAYIVVAVLAFTVLYGSGWMDSVSNLGWPATALVVVSNGAIFFQDLFLFFGIGPDGSLFPTAHFGAEPGAKLFTLLLIPQAWSLGVELTFYAIAPFICRSPLRLSALFCFGLAVRVVLGYWSPGLDPWLYRFSPAEMMLFASGGLGYFAGTWLQRMVPENTMRAVGFACLAFLAAVITALHPHFASLSNSLYLLNWRVLAMIAVSCPFLLAASRGMRFDGLIGELSYPMYLSHIFLYETMSKYTPYILAPNNFLYVCVTIAFSAMLLWLVVLPVDRYRRKFVTPTDQSAGLVPAVLLPPAPLIGFSDENAPNTRVS